MIIYDRTTKEVAPEMPHPACTTTLGRVCTILEGTREIEDGQRITHLAIGDGGEVFICTESTPRAAMEQRIAAAISAHRRGGAPATLAERMANALRLQGSARGEFLEMCRSNDRTTEETETCGP